MKPLYLEPDEEITSVIDRINNEGEHRLAIVVAKNSTLLQSLVNLKLLTKEADRLKKEIVVITANKVGQRLAGQVGLKCYANLGAVGGKATPVASTQVNSTPAEPEVIDGIKVHQYNPNVPIGQTEAAEIEEEPVIEAHEEPAVTVLEEAEEEPSDNSKEALTAESSNEPERDELPVISQRTHKIKLDGPKFTFSWVSVAISAAVLLILLVTAFLFIPRAKVILSVTARPLETKLSLVFASQPTEGVLQGNLVESTQSTAKEFPATGKKDVGTKASGSVSMKNCEDSDSRSVATGAKLTAGGKTFLATNSVTIAGGKFSNGGQTCSSTPSTVNVVAEAPGEAYNLAGATFTINGQSSRVSGTGTTTGGLTKQITVLTAQDIATATAATQAEQLASALAQLKEKANGQVLSESAINKTVSLESVSAKVDDEVEKATYQLDALYSTVVFDLALVTEQAKSKLTSELTANEELTIQPENIVITEPTFSATDSKLTVQVGAKGHAVTKIDKAQLSKALKNRSVQSAKDYLQANYSIPNAEVLISPSWWPQRLPFLSGSISVDYSVTEDVLP